MENSAMQANHTRLRIATPIGVGMGEVCPGAPACLDLGLPTLPH